MKLLRIGEKEFDQYLSEVEGRIAQEGIDIESEVRSILKDVRQKGRSGPYSLYSAL